MSLQAQQNPSAGLWAQGRWCAPQYRVALAPGSSLCCCLDAVKEPVSSYGVIQLSYRVTAQLKKMWGVVHCAILELRIIGNFLWCWCGGIRLPVLIALLLRSGGQCSKQAVQQRLCQHLAVCIFGMSNLLVQGGFGCWSRFPCRPTQQFHLLSSCRATCLGSICPSRRFTPQSLVKLSLFVLLTWAYKTCFVLLCFFWKWVWTWTMLLPALQLCVIAVRRWKLSAL